MYQLNYKSAHLFSIWLNKISKSLFLILILSKYVFFTNTTISKPLTLIECWRNASRIILLIRFRSTAFEKFFLLTTIPSREFSEAFFEKQILSCLSATFSAHKTCLKPMSRSNLFVAENLADLI